MNNSAAKLHAVCCNTGTQLDSQFAAYYDPSMIVSFKDADTELLANGQRVKRFMEIVDYH